MQALQILIIEDERKVAAFIKKGLEENGFSTTVAYDGLEGKSLALQNNFHLIILDLKLPLINGFQLCKIIREVNEKVPILMLTALGSIEDKSKGFDAGADDYLLKPFEVRELILRIKALLKRSSVMLDTVSELKVADLVIHLDDMTVFRNDIKIGLSAKEFKLLEYFVRNKDKVISRRELSEHVWGLNFDTGTNVIDVYINFLRKKMDYNFEKKLIHTRIGIGYILSETQID